MPDVFISYSHIDKKYADAICHHLEEAGIKCWYAPRNIPVGAIWAESIIDAIHTNKVFVIIISRHSVISNQVYKEISLAKENNLKIIPFKISRVKISGDIHSLLETGHWLDAMDKLLYTSLDQLHQKVCEHLLFEYVELKKRNIRIALLTRSIHNLRAGLRNAVSEIRWRIFHRIYNYLRHSSLLMIMILLIVIMLATFLYMAGQKIYVRLFYGIWA